MVEAIIFTIANIFGLSYALSIIIALRQFSNEDPRWSMWRLPIYPIMIRFFVAMIAFVFLLGLLSNKNLLNIYPNLLNIYVVVLKLLFILICSLSIYIVRRFGWPVKNSSTKH
jgi:hypothetical protein